MFRRLEALTPEVVAGPRILVGMVAGCDGALKLLGALGGVPAGTSAAVLLIAGGIELFAGALMAAGLFSRAASPGNRMRVPDESIARQ